MTVIDINSRLEDKKQARLGHEMSGDIAGVLNAYIEQGLEFDMALSTLVAIVFKHIDMAKNPEAMYHFIFKKIRGIE